MSTASGASRKQCCNPNCKQWYPATLEFFHSARNRPDKLYPQCKACANAAICKNREQAKTSKPTSIRRPKEVLPEGKKRCRDCKEIKDATTKFFNAVPAYISEDCLNRQCRECRKKYRRGHNKSVPKVIKPISEKKWCPSCNQEWPATLEYFSYSKGTRDRLAYDCKACANKRSKEYRARPDGFEARQVYRKATYDPEKRRMRRIARRDKEMAYHKRYYATHKEQHKTYQNAYMQIEANKEAKRVRTLNRIARKKAIPGTYTSAQIAEQLKRQHYRCYYAACGFAKFPRVKEQGQWKYLYHIEHTFPISRVVGTDIPANDMGYLVLACGFCNGSKHNKFPWEWPEGGRLL